MSQGVYGQLDARSLPKFQPSSSTMKAVPPPSVPTMPSHSNGRKYLDPLGYEFLPGGAAVAEVTNIIKANLNGSYSCWSKVPQTIRDTWFREFEKKYWWHPENHCRVRDLFEGHGSLQLNRMLAEKQHWKQWKQQSSNKDWGAEISKNKSQTNEKTPFAASSKHKNGKKEKYWPKMDEEYSSQSSVEDNHNERQNIPPEVKGMMDSLGSEVHGKVKKIIKAVNRQWIQKVESLERERDELKGFVQLYAQYLQNYHNQQTNNNAILRGLGDKLSIKDNPKVVTFQPAPPPPPPVYPKMADFRPPPPPLFNPKAPACRPPPPQNHPNFSTFPRPPPYDVSAYQHQNLMNLVNNTSFSDHGLREAYKEFEDFISEDDDFSEDYSDY